MELKRGEIAVNKKTLINHCESLHNCLNTLDKVMKEPESFKRGQKIAKISNAINMEIHLIEHFMLAIPLKKLGNNCILFKPQ